MPEWGETASYKHDVSFYKEMTERLLFRVPRTASHVSSPLDDD